MKFNSILIKSPTVTVDSMSTGDQAVFKDMVAAGRKFNKIIDGGRVSTLCPLSTGDSMANG